MNATLILFALTISAEANVQSVLDELRAAQRVPGVAVVITHRDEIIFSSASGVADIESGRTMTPDTVLYAGSLSKIFTAVTTMKLVEEGKLSVDGPVPTIAAKQDAEDREIRISHLLAHSSGLDREGNFNYWFTARFPDRSSLTDYLAATTLQFSPGARTSYSNIGYATLGLVIEQSSAVSYGDTLKKLVLDPLNMNRTGTGQPDSTLSAGYSPVGRVIPDEDRPFAGLGRKVGDRRIREYHNADAMTPAFGIHTTAHDLSRLARMLLGYSDNSPLSDNTLSRLSDDSHRGRRFSMRFESYKGRPVAGHGGWFAAHRSYLLLDLRSGISVSVMANSDSASPDVIAKALLDATLRTLSADNL